MRSLSNSGSDRVVDTLGDRLTDGAMLDLASHNLSLFAYEALARSLQKLRGARIILPSDQSNLKLLGDVDDRPARAVPRDGCGRQREAVQVVWAGAD
jgi:hypothetical protein